MERTGFHIVKLTTGRMGRFGHMSHAFSPRKDPCWLGSCPDSRLKRARAAMSGDRQLRTRMDLGSLLVIYLG